MNIINLEEINHNNILKIFFSFHTTELPNDNKFYIGMAYVEENFENYIARKGVN